MEQRRYAEHQRRGCDERQWPPATPWAGPNASPSLMPAKVVAADAAELIRAIRVVAAGDALLSPTVTRRLIAEFATRSRATRRIPALDTLTAREREVMALVAAGLSNEEIADRLYTSVSTAKTHATRAMANLAARDRSQLVVFAFESGLVRPGWVE
jgi:DNA-binding NarL/FixJ family response regulator